MKTNYTLLTLTAALITVFSSVSVHALELVKVEPINKSVLTEQLAIELAHSVNSMQLDTIKAVSKASLLIAKQKEKSNREDYAVTKARLVAE